MNRRHLRSPGRTRILFGGINHVPQDESRLLRNPSVLVIWSTIRYQKFEPWNFTSFAPVSGWSGRGGAARLESLSGADRLDGSPLAIRRCSTRRRTHGRNYRRASLTRSWATAVARRVATNTISWNDSRFFTADRANTCDRRRVR